MQKDMGNKGMAFSLAQGNLFTTTKEGKHKGL